MPPYPHHLLSLDKGGWYVRLHYCYLVSGDVRWQVTDDFNGCCLARGVIAREQWESTPYEGLTRMAGNLLKRLAKERAHRPAGQGAADAESKKRYPALTELLTDRTDADGNERDLSSVTIKFQEGSWKGAIHEPNMEMSLWCSSATLTGLLDVLEERLNAEDADWRGWTQKQDKAAQKKRRN